MGNGKRKGEQRGKWSVKRKRGKGDSEGKRAANGKRQGNSEGKGVENGKREGEK